MSPFGANRFEASVRIRRPVDEVFEYYRDLTNLPCFLGDIIAVEPTHSGKFRWTIQGPFGVRMHWTVKLTEERANTLIRYETVGLPGLTTNWEIRFTPTEQEGETEVHEVMTTPLGMLGSFALAMIGKLPAEEMSANLRRLKQVLETGKVTDTNYSVPGKFQQQ
jgi:uncharacterized membrane protein